MAAKSNLKNMVLCLFGTCLFCSAILGGVYALTKEPIDQTHAKILQDAIGTVLLRNADNSGIKEGTEIVLDSLGSPKALQVTIEDKVYEYYTQVADGQPVAYAIKSTVTGFGGPLTLMVGISADRTLVLNTSVLSHSETPGLGAKCTSDEKFMSQWNGLELSKTKLEVQKPVKDGIDAITASTITSKAYTLAVSNALVAFDQIKNEVLTTPSESQTENLASDGEESNNNVEQEVENE